MRPNETRTTSNEYPWRNEPSTSNVSAVRLRFSVYPFRNGEEDKT